MAAQIPVMDQILFLVQLFLMVAEVEAITTIQYIEVAVVVVEVVVAQVVHLLV
jgi:hypothetical protein